MISSHPLIIYMFSLLIFFRHRSRWAHRLQWARLQSRVQDPSEDPGQGHHSSQCPFLRERPFQSAHHDSHRRSGNSDGRQRGELRLLVCGWNCKRKMNVERTQHLLSCLSLNSSLCDLSVLLLFCLEHVSCAIHKYNYLLYSNKCSLCYNWHCTEHVSECARTSTYLNTLTERMLGKVSFGSLGCQTWSPDCHHIIITDIA